jgi:hypothetical protein
LNRTPEAIELRSTFRQFHGISPVDLSAMSDEPWRKRKMMSFRIARFYRPANCLPAMVP